MSRSCRARSSRTCAIRRGHVGCWTTCTSPTTTAGRRCTSCPTTSASCAAVDARRRHADGVDGIGAARRAGAGAPAGFDPRSGHRLRRAGAVPTGRGGGELRSASAGRAARARPGRARGDRRRDGAAVATGVGARGWAASRRSRPPPTPPRREELERLLASFPELADGPAMTLRPSLTSRAAGPRRTLTREPASELDCRHKRGAPAPSVGPASRKAVTSPRMNGERQSAEHGQSQATATASAAQTSRIRSSLRRPRRATRRLTATLSSESRSIAERRGTGSSPGSSATSLGSPRVAVVQGPDDIARRRRPIAASPKRAPRPAVSRSRAAHTTRSLRAAAAPASLTQLDRGSERLEIAPFVSFIKRTLVVCAIGGIDLRGAVGSKQRSERSVEQCPRAVRPRPACPEPSRATPHRRSY